ncbi:MAG: hypothetical protein AB7W16_20290 [Candidatus Obscuribacterales bacterium]
MGTEWIEEKLGAPDIQIHGLQIWVHGRQFPDATDYWDGNWLLVSVRCSAPGAKVYVDGPIIHLSELAEWSVAAERMHATLEGKANLACMEPELSVDLTMETSDQMIMTVDISPHQRSQKHIFRFELDRSYLPELISGCKKVLDSYPIKSEP